MRDQTKEKAKTPLTNSLENNSENSHNQTVSNNDDTGNKQDLCSSGFRVKVFTVDIVRDERRNGDRFGGSSGDDGHEKHDQDENGSDITKQVSGDSRRNQTGSGFAGIDREHQCGGCQTERSGKREGDGEPANSSQKVSLGGRLRAGSNGRLPVGLIDKDGTEVTDNVDNTKHKTLSRKHGEVGSIAVSRNWTASVLGVIVESGFDGISSRVNLLALVLGVIDSFFEEVEDLVRGVNLDVDNEDHEDQNGEDNDGVDVTGQESSLETSRGGVQNDTPRDQESGKSVIHSGQSLNSGSTSKQKHGCNNQVGGEAEEKEGQVGGLSPSGLDNFADGVCRRGDFLEVDGEDSEQQDLDGGTRGIPERSRDSVLPGNVGGLEESGSPSPLTDNDRRGQTGLDHAPSGAVEQRFEIGEDGGSGKIVRVRPTHKDVRIVSIGLAVGIRWQTVDVDLIVLT